MSRRIAFVALISLAGFALFLEACPRKSAPKPSAEELARGQHLAKPFTPPGACFGKPSKCTSDAQCAPPFATCQEGACCSGELDPKTCECRCREKICRARELCCEAKTSSAGERRALGCHPVRECFGPD